MQHQIRSNRDLVQSMRNQARAQEQREAQNLAEAEQRDRRRLADAEERVERRLADARSQWETEREQLEIERSALEQLLGKEHGEEMGPRSSTFSNQTDRESRRAPGEEIVSELPVCFPKATSSGPELGPTAEELSAPVGPVADKLIEGELKPTGGSQPGFDPYIYAVTVAQSETNSLLKGHVDRVNAQNVELESKLFRERQEHHETVWSLQQSFSQSPGPNLRVEARQTTPTPARAVPPNPVGHIESGNLTPSAVNANTGLGPSREGVEVPLPAREVLPSQPGSFGYKPRMRPDKYDGRSDWSEYLQQFKVVASWNKWAADEKAAQLLVNLTGDARSIISEMGETQLADWDVILQKMNDKYAATGRESVYLAEIRMRRQKAGQIPSEWATDVARLMAKAYPRMNTIDKSQLTAQNFVLGLSDKEVRRAVEIHEPRTLDDALSLTLRMESIFGRQRSEATKKPVEATVGAVYRPDPETPGRAETALKVDPNPSRGGIVSDKTREEARLEWQESLMKEIGELTKAFRDQNLRGNNSYSNGYRSAASGNREGTGSYPNRYPPAAQNNKDRVPGACWNCQKPGHQKRDCPRLKGLVAALEMTGDTRGPGFPCDHCNECQEDDRQSTPSENYSGLEHQPAFQARSE